MNIEIIMIVALLICAAIVILGGMWLLAAAPFGYEDEAGFHFDKEQTNGRD